MHTFVTPIIGRCEMMGDYKYEYGHGVQILGSGLDPKSQVKVMLTRSVALSASIQPDFEQTKVMLAVSKLDTNEILGKDLMGEKNAANALQDNWTAKDKQDEQKRLVYDARLRAHMVFHLTASHRLPARKDIVDLMAVNEAIAFLESVINSKKDVENQFVHKFMKTLNDQVVSLELLYNTAVQQVINEFSAIEAMFSQSYVYTYDPAVIFAREIGSRVLSRLFLAAIKTVSDHNTFANMKTFAINDYDDKKLVDLGKAALAAQVTGDSSSGNANVGHKIRCCSKSQVFNGQGMLYGGADKGAILVVHNNSDGFGQNIETENMGGSLDGAIGASSSAAASLERARKDLLDFIF